MKTLLFVIAISLLPLSGIAAEKNIIKRELEKVPKSLFLIKKIKITPDVGEPQFNPQEAQLRTVINDPLLRSTKKFE